MRVPRWLFTSLLPLSAWATRDPRRNGLLGRPLMRALGGATLWMRGGRPQDSIETLGREWQRMFPDPTINVIIRVDTDTVHAEIRTHCPYRGTGNVEGCHRMMEYDRKMLEHLGGELVVLRSQAEPGVTTCQVALRRRGASTVDLPPAHLRARAARSSE